MKITDKISSFNRKQKYTYLENSIKFTPYSKVLDVGFTNTESGVANYNPSNITKLGIDEKDVFENVTKARSGLMNAGSVKEASVANNALTGALTSLFAIAENYPELKADQNFKELQSELTETEDKISYSRQFYNDAVLMYNNKCEQFPSNIIAGMFNFKEADFFEIASGEREAPKVQF